MKTTTKEVRKMSATTLSNSVRIAACVTRQISNGMTNRNAIRQTAHALGISEGAVCAALTVAQDFVADLSALQAA